MLHIYYHRVIILKLTTRETTVARVVNFYQDLVGGAGVFGDGHGLVEHFLSTVDGGVVHEG